MIIKVKTPAKINLVLEILGKRPDGFHEIQSIMQAVSLFDVLTISRHPECNEESPLLKNKQILKQVQDDENKIEISGNSREIPYNEDNIAFKAAKLFLRHAKIENQQIKIHIEKNIPVSAGLAGGSSNAAGVLWGLNKLYEKPLSEEELHLLAAKLGSDVNFCLTGGTCVATSRGEVLQKVETPKLNFLIIKPSNIAISAKEAYTKYSELHAHHSEFISESHRFQYQQILKQVQNDDFGFLKNDLEAAILPDYPEIQEVKNYLLNLGCKGVLMSGSGSAVFGICDKDTDFIDLPQNWQCFKVHSINYGVAK